MRDDEPVRCPNGHPTGRQNPEYAGHGEGIPFATGWFTCEVCLLRYDPRYDEGDIETGPYVV
jgi:hypothetical protein